MSVRTLVNSFRYALEGLAHALATQRNMRIHFIAAFAVIVLCVFVRVSISEIMSVLFAISLVICLELVNTAVEHVVDHLTKERHPAAKIAKDVAAAAVFIAAANALVEAYLVFYDKFTPVHWRSLNTLLNPPYLGVILVGLLCLIVGVSSYALRMRHTKKENDARHEG
ncbi:diacylglycerol kinase family protein [Ferroacidibacillus organovorans]|uniref:Diacylglycerol kinase n=1 Tax=Ferroacidibacillus organovorans TaxID=1765683 RepID=A0A162TS01_9BACL|nr:diacylglycerol kinase family protein [Ferroacidibacillus organovorans]KYP81073.1 hypothetical protein AYJ22_09085 [Ferroacidibacillus organovorans]OAG93702.1 hypothetical protein AYW79_09345 [Ferroacidibacillus organovorans]OPG17477.1 hypothetical protein B2M26_01750 [Ferroacidibacillus organovorans]